MRVTGLNLHPAATALRPVRTTAHEMRVTTKRRLTPVAATAVALSLTSPRRTRLPAHLGGLANGIDVFLYGTRVRSSLL
jgi:hypothetical protein